MQAKRGGGRFNYHGMGAQMPSEDWFEVFISGKAFPYNLANISSKSIKQVVIGQNGQVQQRSSDHMMNSSLVVGIDQ